MKKLIIILIVTLFYVIAHGNGVKLNGKWQRGINRNYTDIVMLPSITEDTEKFTEGTLWFKKEVSLPSGNWQYATLELKGARFSPSVYINGVKVSEKNGGMAPTFHLLKHKDISPGENITIEVALKSLRDITEEDASYIPKADHWRSNISSCLWDDIVLRTHNDIYILNIIPDYNISTNSFQLKYKSNSVTNRYKAHKSVCTIYDGDNIVDKRELSSSESESILKFEKLPKISNWSPENPKLYRIRLEVYKDDKLSDTKEFNYGFKSFEVKGKHIYLNNNRYPLRTGTVVWHRWVRDEEGKELGYNEEWFYKNVVKRLKDHGANTLRFHLGNPPERFIDMCDKYGLLIQYEWSFFHGMPASEESLREQWPAWLNQGILHASLGIVHPYNETHGAQLKRAWKVLDEILPSHPKLVLADRDVLHIHKYWWSLFENLGLYYDSYDEFPKAIMVDEFGGNYLDGDCKIGGYKTAKAAFMRFLGEHTTKENLLHHHTISNSKVAEYWRQLKPAGISAFTILGSEEDGNHWFLGKLSAGKPKPVWGALTSTWSPIAVTMDIWNRNFKPSQTITIPIYLFNDNPEKVKIEFEVSITNKSTGKRVFSKLYSDKINKISQKIKDIKLRLPDGKGRYTIKTEVLTKPQNVKYPIISEWDIRVLESSATNLVNNNIKVYTPKYEKELRKFIKTKGINSTSDITKSDIIVLSHSSWEKISNGDKLLLKKLETSINKGINILMLNAGPQSLGEGYLPFEEKMQFLQGRRRLSKVKSNKVNLVNGLSVTFNESPEPESHIHPANEGNKLWKNLDYDSNWLWNGYRGGLIVPSNTMKLSGMSRKAFLEQWSNAGADKNELKSGNYYVYDLQGFYAFSKNKYNKKVINNLQKRVKFLVDDAPALSASIDPNAKIRVSNLHEAFIKCNDKGAEMFTPLVKCGNSISRTAVVEIDFGENKGKLILSQLLTEGRLSGKTSGKTYEIIEDEAAKQTVINLINKLTP